MTRTKNYPFKKDSLSSFYMFYSQRLTTCKYDVQQTPINLMLISLFNNQTFLNDLY